MSNKHVTLLGSTSSKRPPALTRTRDGRPMTRFTITTSDRIKDKTGAWTDGPLQFYSCLAFDSLAENIVNTCSSPVELLVEGVETREEWQSNEGPRESVSIKLTSAGVSLRRQYANVTKQQGGGGGQQAPQHAPVNDPWGGAPTGGFGGGDDDPPF